jgi:hypothetical protein
MFEARIDQLVFDFNCRPSSYVDANWIDAARRPLLSRLAGSGDTQARAEADRWILQHMGLAGTHDFDFSPPGKRLLLLDAAALKDVARLLGLVSLMHMLRGWITRAQRQHLTDALGEDTARFVFSHLLRWPRVAHRVLDGTQRSRCAKPTSATVEWVDDADCFGTELLLLSCDEPNAGAARRARLKLPPAATGQTRLRPLPPARRQAVLEFAIGCAVRERHPSWHWLF